MLIRLDAPSFAPLGYRNVRRGDGKRVIEPDPDMAPRVIHLFERYATRRYSLKELAHLARELGLRFRKSGDALPRASVHRLLRSRIYMGEFEWRGRIYKGIHEPLVSRKLWDVVQDAPEPRGLAIEQLDLDPALEAVLVEQIEMAL